MKDLLVSEVFGPTVQGEGPSTGRRASFVRLGLCNLDCAWCDTPYTWDWTGKNGHKFAKAEELTRRTVDDVVDDCATRAAELVVITGGEPLMQHRALKVLVHELRANGHTIEIETNGTLVDEAVRPDRFNVSLKLPGSGVDRKKAIVSESVLHYAALGKGAAFKFVVCDRTDLEAVNELVYRFDIAPTDVWLMPEGRTAEQIVRGTAEVTDWSLEFGYNVSTRLHVLIWGDRRGV